MNEITENGDQREQEQAARDTLAEAGLNDEAIEKWLNTPSGWLDGEVPASLLQRRPEAVVQAARRKAATAAERTEA